MPFHLKQNYCFIKGAHKPFFFNPAVSVKARYNIFQVPDTP